MFNLKQILDFLKKLENNNNKPWFDENRDEYKAARLEWIRFAEHMLGELGDIYQEFFEMDPRKCIFRINRDVRFSKNKQPYKNNFGAHFVPGGKKSGNSGFYLHLEPGNCFLAVGIYHPESSELFRIRTYISEHYKKLETILNNPAITDNFVEGMREYKLKRQPRSFDKAHPAIELLKHKHFIVIHNFKDKEVLNKKFEQEASIRFHQLADFNQYLNTALLTEVD